MSEKKLSEAENYVMQQFWKHGAMKADDLMLLVTERGWKRSTLLTFLTRLEDKGMLAVDRRKKHNLYQPAITQQAYRKAQLQVFLEDVYDGSARDFLAAMVDSKGISKEEFSSLRRWLLEEEVDPDA